MLRQLNSSYINVKNASWKYIQLMLTCLEAQVS